MIGTLINFASVILGSLAGLSFGSRLPDRIRQTLVAGLGLFTGIIGIKMFLNSQNELIVLGSLLLGGLLGEWMRIEDALKSLGGWLETHFSKIQAKTGEQAAANLNPHASRDRFIQGFLTASLVFCIGPMAILGSIQDGLTGDYKMLAIKSTLDGFASLAFASSLGIGVLFSSLPILVYQGSITLLASLLQAVLTQPMMNEMTATGGVLLFGIAISSLLQIKPIRIGSFLPALAFAPLIVALLALVQK